MHPTQRKTQIIDLCEELLRLTTKEVYCKEQWNNYVQMIIVLERIKCLEKTKTESSERSQGIERFTRWLRQKAVYACGFSVAEFPGYDLGLKSECHILEYERIVSISRDHIFTARNAAPELQTLRSDPLIREMPQIELAMALLIEKFKEHSSWKPYLDILPATYTTVLYMKAADMAELKGSPTLDDALKQCRNIARQYAHFKILFQHTTTAVSKLLRNIFTFERYCWAVSTVMTRQNVIPSKNDISSREVTYALIPLWDLCNHESGTVTTHFDIGTNTCVCYAMRNFWRGEQIFIDYGTRTNSDFFIHSGFVYMNNKHDIYKLRLPSPEQVHSSQSDDEFRALLKRLDIPATMEMTYTLTYRPEPIPGSLLAYMRLRNMSKEDVRHWLRSDRVEDLKLVDCDIADDINKGAQKSLLNALQFAVDKYPTTLEHDLQLLKETLPQLKKLAIQLRVTEKRVLSYAIEYVKKMF